MFGRLFKIYLTNSVTGESIVLVDTLERQYNDYSCKGTIERFPGSQVDCLTLSIFNLDPIIRGEISVKTYDTITVDFGYRDEGNVLTTLFRGYIVRPLFKRSDPSTDETVIYAYDTGDFKIYGFFSKTYLDGVNYYDIAKEILERGRVKISYALSEKLKDYKTNGTETFYGSQDEVLNNIAEKCNLNYKSENNVAKFFDDFDTVEDIYVFSREVSNGKVISESGLIGIPTLSTDGLYFDCLIIPNLRIFNKIKISNSIISNEQDGAIPRASAGGQLNPNGYYKIVKLTIQFDNMGGECKSSVKAISVDIDEENKL